MIVAIFIIRKHWNLAEY